MIATVKAFVQRTVRLDQALVILLVILMVGFLLSSRGLFRSAKTAVSSSDIGLSKLVTELRSELENMEQERASKQQSALFRIKNVDLELNFVVKVDQTNKNELKFEAVTVGLDQSASLERSDKITLHLEIDSPEWMDVVPAHLSVDDTAKELTAVPLGQKERNSPK